MVNRWLGMILCFFFTSSLLGVKISDASAPLPKPSLDGKVSVEKAIKGRRTIRDFKDRPLPLSHLSQLLWAGQGITDLKEKKRAAPSAGALYPLDIYVIVGEKGLREWRQGYITTCLKDIQFHSSQKEIFEKRLPQPLYGKRGWLKHLSSLLLQQNIEGSWGSMVREGFDTLT